MRIITSLLVFCYSFFALSQRVYFEDPSLTFSFKKAKQWVVVDDGYVIKVSPAMRDTAITYLTITYFEPPAPQSNLDGTQFTVVELQTDTKSEFEQYMLSDDGLLILGFDVRPKRSMITKKDIPIEKRFYDFYRYNKNWEVVTSAHADDYKKYHQKFKSILKSLQVEQRKSASE